MIHTYLIILLCMAFPSEIRLSVTPDLKMGEREILLTMWQSPRLFFSDRDLEYPEETIARGLCDPSASLAPIPTDVEASRFHRFFWTPDQRIQPGTVSIPVLITTTYCDGDRATTIWYGRSL